MVALGVRPSSAVLWAAFGTAHRAALPAALPAASPAALRADPSMHGDICSVADMRVALQLAATDARLTRARLHVLWAVHTIAQALELASLEGKPLLYCKPCRRLLGTLSPPLLMTPILEDRGRDATHN